MLKTITAREKHNIRPGPTCARTYASLCARARSPLLLAGRRVFEDGHIVGRTDMLLTGSRLAFATQPVARHRFEFTMGTMSITVITMTQYVVVGILSGHSAARCVNTDTAAARA